MTQFKVGDKIIVTVDDHTLTLGEKGEVMLAEPDMDNYQIKLFDGSLFWVTSDKIQLILTNTHDKQ